MRWQEFERFNGGSPSFRKNGSARTPRRQNTSRRVCARWNIIAEFQASFRACYHHDRWIERESLSLSLSLSNDPCRNPSWTKSRIVYIHRSRMFVPRSARRHRVSRFHLSAYNIISHCALRRLVSERGSPIISISLECRAIVSTALTMAELLLHADTTVNLFTSYFGVGRLVTWRDVYDARIWLIDSREKYEIWEGSRQL